MGGWLHAGHTMWHALITTMGMSCDLFSGYRLLAITAMDGNSTLALNTFFFHTLILPYITPRRNSFFSS